MDSDELVKGCLEWQLDNMKFGSWTKNTEG
jgi:hypothetical protein